MTLECAGRAQAGSPAGAAPLGCWSGDGALVLLRTISKAVSPDESGLPPHSKKGTNMIKESMRSMWQTTRSLFSQRASLAIFAGLYVLLLAVLYGFIAIREATVWQVLLTLLFVALAPVIFFLLQAAIIDHARTGHIDWPQALRDSTKLALVAVPVILLGLGIMWLLNRWQRHFPAPYFNPVIFDPAGNQGRAIPPLHWPTVLFASSRALIFGVFLPLVLIHLWVAVAGQSLLAFVRWPGVSKKVRSHPGAGICPRLGVDLHGGVNLLWPDSL